jgi:hypothetical protein
VAVAAAWKRGPEAECVIIDDPLKREGVLTDKQLRAAMEEAWRQCVNDTRDLPDTIWIGQPQHPWWRK